MLGPLLAVSGVLVILSPQVVDFLGPGMRAAQPLHIVTLTAAAFFVPSATLSAVTPVVGESHNNGVYLGSLDGDEPPQRILPSNFSAQVVDGWLLHVKDGSLLASELDVDSGGTPGRPRVVAKGITPDLSTWHGQFSASAADVLTFHRGSAEAKRAGGYSWSMNGDFVSSWSYDGRQFTTYAADTPMYSIALSPDGRTLAMDGVSPDGYTDIWLCPTRLGIHRDSEELVRELASPSAPRRLTFLPGPEYRPVWSPDGTELVFRWDGDDERPRGIYRKRVGGGSETLVRDNGGEDDHATDWTPDGRYLVVTTGTILPSDNNDLIAVPLAGGPEIPLVVEPGPQLGGKVSPDGRWLAYVDSSATGSVFVIPFAPAWPEDRQEGRWLVSEGSAYAPRWSQAGDELYYVTESGVLTAVDVETDGDTFAFATPRSLFQSPWRLDRSYDPAPAFGPNPAEARGSFLFLDSDSLPEGQVSVLLGWTATLEEE